MKYGKPDASMMINGMLAGLVAISAPCAFVSSFWACVIGAFAGLLVCWSVFYGERSLKVDDPVGAISVHGSCGAWCVLSLGLSADGIYVDGFIVDRRSGPGYSYGIPNCGAAHSTANLS